MTDAERPSPLSETDLPRRRFAPGQRTFPWRTFASLASMACEKASHDNIDKWKGTERGPGKLEDALKDKGLEVALISVPLNAGSTAP